MIIRNQRTTPPTLIERVAHLLLGMADLFVLLAEQCRKFAAEILAQLSPDQKGA